MSRVAIVRAQRQVTVCERCPITGTNTPMVSPAVAQYAVLGEAPGNREVQKREPFVGPAGRKLRKALERAGLDADAAAYLNVISCLPPRQPPTPEGAEVAACLPNRIAQLEACEAEVVLACGNVALRTFRTEVSIGTAWGIPFVKGERVVIPSIHPSAVLRDPGQGWKLDKAIRKLAMLVTGEGLAGEDLLGKYCLQCNRYTQETDETYWPWCQRHMPKKMTDKKREKLMKDARVAVNRKKQGVLAL